MRLLALASLVLAACGAAAAARLPTFADQRCADSGLAMANAYTLNDTATLALAVDAAAGEVADWQEAGYHGPDGPRLLRSAWRDLPASEPIALCYYDGSFDNYAPSLPPPLSGSASPPEFERALFIVDARVARLVTIGPAANLPRLK